MNRIITVDTGIRVCAVERNRRKKRRQEKTKKKTAHLANVDT
jgi:hypothetical protein